MQGPSAAVLRMLINSTPYVPIFLQFQSIAFSRDLGPRISSGSLWGKTTGNVHLTDPGEEKDQSNMLRFYFNSVLIAIPSVGLIGNGSHSPDDKFN